jgi:hypothetical protein
MPGSLRFEAHALLSGPADPHRPPSRVSACGVSATRGEWCSAVAGPTAASSRAGTSGAKTAGGRRPTSFGFVSPSEKSAQHHSNNPEAVNADSCGTSGRNLCPSGDLPLCGIRFKSAQKPGAPWATQLSPRTNTAHFLASA